MLLNGSFADIKQFSTTGDVIVERILQDVVVNLIWHSKRPLLSCFCLCNVQPVPAAVFDYITGMEL